MQKTKTLADGRKVPAGEYRILQKSQQGELDAVLMYRALAKTVKLEKDRKIFLQLAAEEGRHASVFRAITGETLPAKKTKAVLLPVLYRVFGRKILYPVIAKREYAAFDTYVPLTEKYPSAESVRADEKRHGDMIRTLLEKEDA